MTSSEFATICLASLKSYSGKVDLLIFPYDNVSFLLRNDIVLEGDQKYVTYKLKQMATTYCLSINICFINYIF